MEACKSNMAQAKVSDYFETKKRSQANPSKKRKIVSEDLDLKVSAVTETSVKSGKTTEAVLPCGKQNGRTPRSRTRSKTPTTRTRASGSVRKNHTSTDQATIQDAFAKASGSSSDNDNQGITQDVVSSEVTEEVTSCWDEHDGTHTPKRKTRPSESIAVPLSDSRENKQARRRKQLAGYADSVTPKKDAEGEEEKAARGRSLAESFRRSLTADHAGSAGSSSKASEDQDAIHVKPPSPISKPEVLPVSADSQLVKSVRAKQSDPTPSDKDLNQQLESQHPVPMVGSSKEKLKELQKADDVAARKSDKMEDEPVVRTAGNSNKVIRAEVMRERLAKCGKLDTLKAKLAEMNSSLKAVRNRQAEKTKAKADVDEADVEKTSTKAETVTSATPAEAKAVPAYERYEHLAREGPPSLALPGKYQRLLSTFQGTDTVVSMLFNRQEAITFSKLQTAVQSMTRKNFQQKDLGQMKTVYPDAYNFRQEKGFPSFGKKVTGYQLTVEPNLESVVEKGLRADKNEKQTMTAQVLLKRKRIFHNSLVNITKDHHARFLSKQKPPIQVSPSLLTRWHPRFPLDTVPDIETAELPAPPLQKTQSAKQVLEYAKGKLPPRVEAALANVAMKSESSQPKASPSKEQSKTPSAGSTSKPASSAYRGIPLSLLEKIRAKEAARTQAALTRDPKENKKTEMIGRLPTLIRSLRTFYVTEKKPSLLYKTVVEKLVDSYDTFISSVEVEAHLVLLQELAPKWIQVIEVARGKYVKIDKNMDISLMITHLNNLAKNRQ